MKKITILSILLLITLSACANNSVSIEGNWKLVSYGDASNPTSALPNVETSINFNAENKLNGDVGCNTFNAGYTIEKDKVTFQPIASTKMFCNEIGEQESIVLSILSDKTLTVKENGNQLILTSADASSIVVLEKK